MFPCTYCLERKPDSERSEEHVIPAALGGSWTVMDVCETCQEWANREIDRPFNQSLWVLEQRHRHRIPDRYGNVPDAPRVEATVADGRRSRSTRPAGTLRSSHPRGQARRMVRFRSRCLSMMRPTTSPRSLSALNVTIRDLRGRRRSARLLLMTRLTSPSRSASR
jgi:hypothetical protein